MQAIASTRKENAEAAAVGPPQADSAYPGAAASKRNSQMDVLRGVAVLLVIGSHLSMERPSEGLIGAFARWWSRYGQFGVSLFFVLSGFLISGLLLSEFQKRGNVSISRFLVRRGLKIYPPYFVFIAYLFAVPIIKSASSGGSAGDLVKSLLDSYWPNLLFIHNYIGAEPAGHTWSIAVEEHFYLALPLIVVALIKLGHPRWLLPLGLCSSFVFILLRCVCAFAGDPYLSDLNRTMAATHLCVDGLFLGVGLRALAVYEPRLFARLRSWRIPLMILAIFLLTFPMAGTLWEVPLHRILPLQTWAAAALFLSIYHTNASDFWPIMPGIRRIIVSPLATIGAYSYSIYLWHVTVIGVAGKGIERLPWIAHQPSFWALAAAMVCSATVLTGIAVAHLVEWPVLRVRDKFFPSRS